MANKNRTRMRSQTKQQSDLNSEIAKLPSLSTQELHAKWYRLTRSKLPPHLPRYLLQSLVAYRMQAKTYGDLDAASVRYLGQVAKNGVYRSSKRKSHNELPPVPTVPRDRSLKPGTIIAREYDGRMERVTVLRDGFSWSGRTYQSLSEIAFVITGTKWNGPRFFGLRDKRRSRAIPSMEDA